MGPLFTKSVIRLEVLHCRLLSIQRGSLAGAQRTVSDCAGDDPSPMSHTAPFLARRVVQKF